MKFWGTILHKKNSSVSPTVYLDYVAVDPDTGEVFPAKEVAEKIIELVAEHEVQNNDAVLADVSKYFNRDYVLANVKYVIVNREKNEESLRNMPHKELLDLAAIYKVMIELPDGTGAFEVDNCKLEMWKITEEELDRAARKNSGQFKILNMEELVSSMMDIPVNEMPESGFPMLVLTNEERLYGASVMLYTDCFDSVAKMLDSDLYILPSSIHELIVIPFSSDMCVKELRDMVHTVNNTQVEPHEILSYSVYRYNREKKELEYAWKDGE